MASTYRTVNERLARLEETLKAHADKDEMRLSSIDGSLTKLTEGVDSIRLALTKQRGFIAGIVFIISALWGVAIAVFKLKG